MPKVFSAKDYYRRNIIQFWDLKWTLKYKKACMFCFENSGTKICYNKYGQVTWICYNKYGHGQVTWICYSKYCQVTWIYYNKYGRVTWLNENDNPVSHHNKHSTPQAQRKISFTSILVKPVFQRMFHIATKYCILQYTVRYFLM